MSSVDGSQSCVRMCGIYHDGSLTIEPRQVTGGFSTSQEIKDQQRESLETLGIFGNHREIPKRKYGWTPEEDNRLWSLAQIHTIPRESKICVSWQRVASAYNNGLHEKQQITEGSAMNRYRTLQKKNQNGKFPLVSGSPKAAAQVPSIVDRVERGRKRGLTVDTNEPRAARKLSVTKV